MSDDKTRDQSVCRLRRASADESLTPVIRSQADALAHRLETGVTVALLGPKGSGKSTLLNLLLQQHFAPAPDGIAARVISCDAAIDDLSAAAPGPLDRVGATCSDLGTVRFIDVQGAADPAVHKQRHTWALGVADMVLWCGQSFDRTDHAIWSKGADALKDHSFLVVTQADRLAAAGTLKENILHIRTSAADEFHRVFPITAAQFQRLQPQEAPLTDDAFAASGAKSLSDAMMQLAEAGQQADLDGALLFLERYGIGDEPAAAEALAPDQATSGYAQVLAMIRTGARELAAEMADPKTDVVQAVLGACSALSEKLADFMDGVESSSSSIAVWKEELMAANDKIVLMGLEGDLRSAADAVTILLQVSRDLEQRVIH
ncbi:MAG: ATP-binding cassette domain-containing protein [Pseudomonadota bacterium]